VQSVSQFQKKKSPENEDNKFWVEKTEEKQVFNIQTLGVRNPSPPKAFFPVS
jgi:hypothetical protein